MFFFECKVRFPIEKKTTTFSWDNFDTTKKIFDDAYMETV